MIKPKSNAKATVSYHLALPTDGTNLFNTLFHNHGPTKRFIINTNTKATTKAKILTFLLFTFTTLLLSAFSTTLDTFDEPNIIYYLFRN